jgi:hypothetical protein
MESHLVNALSARSVLVIVEMDQLANLRLNLTSPALLYAEKMSVKLITRDATDLPTIVTITSSARTPILAQKTQDAQKLITVIQTVCAACVP